MEEHSDDQPTPERAATSPDSAQKLHRDVTTLVATVEQHSAELDAMNLQQLVLVFAFGALAGIVFLQHRQIRGLADALGG